MMLKRILQISVLLLLPPIRAWSDEGMWTFDNPPRKLWKERYNFDPSAEWLDHVRLSSVRLSDGGSGAFVSPSGLIITNQHVAADQLQKISTAEKDYTKDGFYAPDPQQELKCPDLEIDVLISFENVTQRVRDAVKPGASDNAAEEQRKAETAKIEKESTEKTSLRSEVVKLYSGGEYWLYRFKKYTDVRLVFATEEQIAFYGGDYDNFTFPRHDVDVAFFRVYENGRPLKTDHYFKWSSSGAPEGELVFVPGNPGSTDRLLTLSQIYYQRDHGNPLQEDVWKMRKDLLKQYSNRGAEEARRAGPDVRSFDNSLKRLTGQQEGLLNPRLFARKEAEEKALREKVASSSEWSDAYADAWSKAEAAYRQLPSKAKQIAYSTLTSSNPRQPLSWNNPLSRLALTAAVLVRYGDETSKPNETRYEEFRDSKLESLRFNLLSEAPIYADMEEFILAKWLEQLKNKLGPDDPFVKAALNQQTPAEAAAKAVKGTRLGEIGFRKMLLDGGAAAISQSKDPMIEFARRVEPVTRELRNWVTKNIWSIDTAVGEKIAGARFAVYGKSLYPDATFSLRLGYGRVLGYEEDTTLVPYKTTFYGLFDRAESFDEKPPYHLPARYKTRKSKINLSTPLNFVYSGDTIGGNSGSPIINRNAEVVGLNFDSNIQKLSNRYWYVDESEGGRAIAVHSAGIIEALKSVYDAEKLADEILGR